MKNTLKTVGLFACLSLFVSCAALAVDLGQVEKDLSSGGVEGWIHGAVSEQGLYVFTYRNPKNFFDYVIMSLVSDDDAMVKKFASFGRNDKVKVKGRFLKNPSPQKHIDVTSIELVKKYENPYPSDPYQHEAKIPDELVHQNSATFLVHAIAGDGHILVLEYKDSVVPVYVKNTDRTKNLARNDLIALHYKIQKNPDQPTHLNVDEAAAEPVKVLESIRALHGKPAVIEGALILFPKSPEISFNVFAVQQELQAGLSRQYTIVNFDDSDAFAKVRAKLQNAWDKFPGQYKNARNKLLSLHIHVKVTGTYNEVDASQANPQVLVKGPESVEIIEK